jgi:hypothetical protein
VSQKKITKGKKEKKVETETAGFFLQVRGEQKEAERDRRFWLNTSKKRYGRE